MRNVLEFMGVLQPTGGPAAAAAQPQEQQQQQQGGAPPGMSLLSMPLSFDYLEVLSHGERLELGAFIAQVGCD